MTVKSGINLNSVRAFRAMGLTYREIGIRLAKEQKRTVPYHAESIQHKIRLERVRTKVTSEKAK